MASTSARPSRRRLKSGDLTGALGQQPFLQGFWPVMQLYLQIDRGISAANLDTRAQLVTKEPSPTSASASRTSLDRTVLVWSREGYRSLATVPFDASRNREQHCVNDVTCSALGRRPAQLFGGWEVGLLVMMALLYVVGAFINPKFFVSTRRVPGAPARRLALRRDGGRHDVRHRQQGSRPVGRLDIRPGRRRLRHTCSIRNHYDLGVVPAIFACLVLGNVHRPGQRHSRHRPARAGVHRDADHALHRPRLRPRPDGRASRSSTRKGRRLSLVLPARRIQRLGLQQPDYDRAA